MRRTRLSGYAEWSLMLKPGLPTWPVTATDVQIINYCTLVFIFCQHKLSGQEQKCMRRCIRFYKVSACLQNCLSRSYKIKTISPCSLFIVSATSHILQPAQLKPCSSYLGPFFPIKIKLRSFWLRCKHTFPTIHLN